MRFLAVLLAVFLPTTAFAAMSSEEKEATFWRVAVVDFAGRTPKTDGASAGVRVAAALRNSKRFHVVNPAQVRKAVRSLKIDVSQGKIEDDDAKRLAKALRVDGVFVGALRKAADGTGVLTLALHSGSSGRLFAQYRFAISPQFAPTEAEKIAKSFTSRLPYDGMVVSVRGDLALINLGTANGIANGSKVYGFEFESLRRDANDSVTGGDRKLLSELEVVRAERHGSWVRPMKGEMPDQFVKVSLRPVAGATELKPVEETRATVSPFVNLQVDGDVAFLFKSYELTGDGTKFSSDTTLFPAPGLRFEWFPKRSLGATMRLRHGFIPFRREAPGAPGTVETYNGSITSVEAEAKLRKVFGSPGYFAGGSVAVGGGAHFSSFRVDDHNPRVLTNDTYIGPLVSTDLLLPLLDRINARARLGVVPLAIVSESPVDNGSGKAFGITGTVGLDYHINEKLFVSFQYGMDSMRTTFPSGGGSRAISNPKASDLYHGVTMTLGWRSYR